MRARTLITILLAIAMASCGKHEPKAKYVFYFIGDGMGVSHVTLAKLYADSVLLDSTAMSFTRFPVTSLSTTYAHNRYVTCSAAAGTALSTGTKTSINTIGLTYDRTDTLYSIAKKFKEAGKKVAILTSVSIDHATPAAFYAHVGSRGSYYDIAKQLLKSNYDFFASGGFLEPYGTKTDSNAVSVYELGKVRGCQFTSSLTEVDSLVAAGAKSIVYSAPNPAPSSTLQYEIDRSESDISLADITRKAIEVVDNPNGFFIMVEGGKIDWAAHDNDAATVIHEVLAFARAIDVALEFYRKHPHETLIVVTADHETGGLSIGNRENKYDFHVKLLHYQTASEERLHKLIAEFKEQNPKAKFDDLLKFLADKTGLSKDIELNENDIKMLKDAYNVAFKGLKSNEKTTYSETDPISKVSIQILNSKAAVGWTSGSHTGQPVPVFAIGSGQQLFVPLLDNTDIPKNIVRAAGI
ncbi:MAG: alkaline phosphatase [Tenuifilum sp.]|uniref:alkaline phosphatase n=2 Tax=Tenuifilum sp. TaxID=2760880 RepID=UPI001B4E8A7D|nr:alkaline phosphatase [Bacteroidales bacterium]HON70012.1 alkaline phosphatase [Tenuifilum sp.]MBP9028621.1 alkaline phosphatase [Bacteroidales bacterium]HOU73439.1 alkaline phosphatase [Tenuifilum sp.]HQE53794.1 alkaline phosphatase [Tenuifilum sp.]